MFVVVVVVVLVRVVFHIILHTFFCVENPKSAVSETLEPANLVPPTSYDQSRKAIDVSIK